MIQEIITKKAPVCEIKDLGEQVQIVLHVEEEESSKDIELDISESQIKMNSKYYEM